MIIVILRDHKDDNGVRIDPLSDNRNRQKDKRIIGCSWLKGKKGNA